LRKTNCLTGRNCGLQVVSALFCSAEPHLDDVDRKTIKIMAFGRFYELVGEGGAFDLRDGLVGLLLFSITR
jgi:hypothetical protein